MCSGPNRGFVAGDASFGSLTISGSLVGFKTLKFSGDAAANTVLFHSSTVTITLDKRTLSDFLPPVSAGAGPVPALLPRPHHDCRARYPVQQGAPCSARR